LLVCPILATVHSDNPFIIIYIPTISLFYTVTMEMASEKLLLVPHVTALYNYVRFKFANTIFCHFI
jgi:hypothetical protein